MRDFQSIRVTDDGEHQREVRSGSDESVCQISGPCNWEHRWRFRRFRKAGGLFGIAPVPHASEVRNAAVAYAACRTGTGPRHRLDGIEVQMNFTDKEMLELKIIDA